MRVVGRGASLAVALLMIDASGCAGDDLRQLTCSEGETRVDGICRLVCDSRYTVIAGECVLVCAAGYELVDGACLELCPEHWVRDGVDCVCAEGYELVANDCVPVCADGFELIGEVCLSPCDPGAQRNNTGVCEALGRVEGKVCDVSNGTWFEGVDVTILLPDGNLLTTATAADGSFTITDVPPGQHYVEYAGPGGYVNAEPVEVAPGETVTVGHTDCEPLPGHLGGSVCDESTGTWVEGASISIDAPGIASTTTDANGDFWFYDVPPGDYIVTVVTPGSVTETRDVTVEAGQVIDVGPHTCAPVIDPCVEAPPVAAAGADIAALPNDTVSLDATGSSDPTGQTLTYAWTITQRPTGSSASLSDSTSAAPTVFVDEIGQYLVCLVVTDEDACNSPRDCVSISVAPISCTNTGPTAVAGTDVSAVPDETVALDGTGSSDPAGQALTYSWRVATRPSGSTSTLSDATAASPTLLADVSGDFEVCLTVTDPDDCISAEDCLTITVAPLVAFHIELVWDTDDTDIDLHYKNPGANFRFELFPCFLGSYGDTYFACMTPDWGPLGPDGSAGNNPRLDVDNMQGFGPENINQDNLWDSGQYVIGVHFWSGDNATVARVRVYADGVLAYEASSPPMSCGDFWEVADVQVSSSGTVVGITANDTYTIDLYTLACQ